MSVPISFNLLGGCVLRDSFGMHENDGGYKINRYSSKFSPFFLNDKGFDITEEEWKHITSCDSLSSYSNFVKRCVFFELTRHAKKYVEEIKSDYLMIDVDFVRHNYVKINDTYFLNYEEPFFLSLKEHGFIDNIKHIDYDFMDKSVLDEKIIEYANSLKEICEVNHIILLEINHAMLYYDFLDKKKYFYYAFTSLQKQNMLMNYIFSKLKQSLNGCHVIEFPDFIIGDKQHKFGCDSLHFVKEYYDYVLNCINIIISNNINELELLEDERKKVSLLIQKKYF